MDKYFLKIGNVKRTIIAILIFVVLFFGIFFNFYNNTEVVAIGENENYLFSETVTVTFDNEDIDNMSAEEVRTIVAGTSLGVLPVTPVKGVFVFVGWNTDVDGLGYYVDQTTIIDNSITLYASFKEGDYELNAYASVGNAVTSVGGKVLINNSVLDGERTTWLNAGDAVILGAEANDYYKFVGWYSTLAGTLVSDNSVYLFYMPEPQLGDGGVYATINYYAKFEFDYWTNYITAPTQGLGVEQNPYIIKTSSNLAWIAYNANTTAYWSQNKYFVLESDLDLEGFMWEPIGNNDLQSEDYRFKGSFDGNGHIVENIQLNLSGGAKINAGFFGYIDSTVSVIENLGIVNSNIMAESAEEVCVGVIAGYVNGATIQNCFVKNCVVQGKINVSNSLIDLYGYVGGLVGFNSGGTIINCYNYSNIEAENTFTENGLYVGGLVGLNTLNGAIISKCYNVGSITINGDNDTIYKGFLIGQNLTQAQLEKSFYNLETGTTDIGAVGDSSDFSTETEVYSKTLLELTNSITYTTSEIDWNFEDVWLITELNDNLPILKGVGNMLVTVDYSFYTTEFAEGEEAPTDFGTVSSEGLNIYNYDALVQYTITPQEGYEVDKVLLDGQELTYYEGFQIEKVYTMLSTTGEHTFSITFRYETIIETPSYIYVIIPAVLFLMLIIFIWLNRITSKPSRGTEMKPLNEEALNRALKLSEEDRGNEIDINNL